MQKKTSKQRGRNFKGAKIAKSTPIHTNGKNRRKRTGKSTTGSRNKPIVTGQVKTSDTNGVKTDIISAEKINPEKKQRFQIVPATKGLGAIVVMTPEFEKEIRENSRASEFLSQKISPS
jgi:hypothetical protein